MTRRTRRSGRPARHTLVLVESSTKLTPKEFTLLGIEKLRFAPGRAVHAVYSGFNAAFRAYFPDLDVVEEMQTLAETGVIAIIPARTGGVCINTTNASNIIMSVPAPAVKALITMGLAS